MLWGDGTQPRRVLAAWTTSACVGQQTLMSVVANVSRNCPACSLKPPLVNVTRPLCRAACAADVACKCAFYRKVPPLRCLFFKVPCDDPAMRLAPDATATFDAIFKCTPRPPPVTPPPPPVRAPSTPPPSPPTPPPNPSPPPAGCVAGPGAYAWPVAAAAVGVTRGYLANGLRKVCTCATGSPPFWNCTQSSDPKSGFHLDYGYNQYSANATGFSIIMDKNWNGARIRTDWAARSATYCAQINPPAGLNPTGVFAFYASSGEPWNRATAKWDELDMEFLLYQNEQLWLNTWHDGKVMAGEEGFKPLPFSPNGAWHKYCFDWDLRTQQAKWFVDDKLFHEYAMNGTWVKPLYVYGSFWGKSDPWCGEGSWDVPRTTSVADMAYEIRLF